MPSANHPYSDPTTHNGRLARRLNAAGQAFFAARLADYDGKPIRLFSRINPKLAALLANKHGNDFVNDLCVVGLFHAVLHYDPLSACFTTYAPYWMRKEVLDGCYGRVRRLDGRPVREARRDAVVRRRFCGEVARRHAAENPGILRDYKVIEYPAGRPLTEDVIAGDEEVAFVLSRLTPREARVVRERFVDGRSAAEVAARLRVSRQVVQKAVRSAREKIMRRSAGRSADSYSVGRDGHTLPH